MLCDKASARGLRCAALSDTEKYNFVFLSEISQSENLYFPAKILVGKIAG